MSDEKTPPRDPLGLDLDAVDRDIELNELRAQTDEMGMSSSYVNPECPPEVESQFLQNIIRFERGPFTSHFLQLLKDGIELPAPQSLADADLHAKLWEVIHALARRAAYLYATDHMSDRTLYEHLWSDTLHEEIPDMSDNPGYEWHLDLVSSGSDEETEAYLRYYANDETRGHWMKDFPDYDLPPREKAPYDRDRLLPKSPPDEPGAYDSDDDEADADGED